MAGTLKLGSIPPLSVWQNEELNFKVASRLGSGATFTKRAMPRPSGEMRIEESTGVFSYKPAPTDREQITVWLKARKDGQEERQKFVITPQPLLPPEYDVIRHMGSNPSDPSSTSFVTVAIQPAGRALFNNITDNEQNMVETKQVFVSGVRVILESDNAAYPLFERLHQREDLKSVTICADEVVVRSPLELPGTEVNIYAHRLVFEDSGGEKGSINTTPRSYPEDLRPKDRGEGLKGQNAGDVNLYAREIVAPGPAIRVIANGGRGQAARAGLPGADGDSYGVWDGKCLTTTFYAGDETLDWSNDFHKLGGYKPVYAQIWEYYGPGWKGPWYYRTERGTQKWPTDGKPPKVYPGRPGQGGNGGDIRVADLDEIRNRVQMDAGTHGKVAAKVDGGHAGQPSKSCHARAEYTKYSWIPSFDKPGVGDGILNRKRDLKILEDKWKHETKDGPPGPSLPPDPAKEGKKGNLRSINAGGRSFWLHAATVRAIIPYVHEMMLIGQGPLVRDLLVRYRDAAVLKAKSNPDDPEWSALHTELAALVERVDSPYDYFGNPAGWVPMLSFEANMSLFEQEIGDAIRVFFLAYWIEKNKQKEQKAAATIKEAMQRLREETERAIKDYDAALKTLGKLEEQGDALDGEITRLSSALTIKEQELRGQVQADLTREHMFRSAAKIVGGVMQLVPVGQPALGAFGKATMALGDIDFDKPFSVAPKIAGALAPLAKKTLKPKVEKLFEGLKKAKANEKVDAEKEKFDKAIAKDKFKNEVKEYLDDQKKAKEEVIEGFSGLAVKDDEVKERLAKVVADCPEYKELVKKIEAINERKAALAADLFAAMQTIDESAVTIMTNQFALYELRSQRDATLDSLSHDALQHARGMGERARRRLQRYQYYMLKSYHFMAFQDMPGIGFRAQRLFDEFANYLEKSKGGALTQTDLDSLRVVFEDQLKEAVDQIIGWYQTHASDRTGSFPIELTPAQLETLNGSEGLLDLDLMRLGVLDLTQDNIRITGIEAKDVEITSTRRTAAVNLEFHHSGTSLLRWDGRVFLFRTGDYRVAAGGAGGGQDSSTRFRNDTMYWKTVVDLDDGKQTLEVTQPNPDKQSLVRHLINKNKPGSVKENILDHQPAAWSVINIRRSTSPVGAVVKLTRLVLRIHYVSNAASRKLSTVLVRMPLGDEAQPVIQCDATDTNGRSDGQGTFLRTFDKSLKPSVTFVAPSSYGRRSFRGWRLVEDKDGGGATQPTEQEKLDPSPSLTLDLEKRREYLIEPVYDPETNVPVNAAEESWPPCPAGWNFEDWLFVNNSRGAVRIVKFDADPWKDKNPDKGGFPATVGEPQGTNITKLSFDRLTLLPREAARFSVCVNPEVPGGSRTQVRFVWEDIRTKTYYCFYFDGKGRPSFAMKWQDIWVDAEESIGLDSENRILTFRP
jgi:hypothetical protein